MLTDSVSQFETKGVNDIPKSFQKLINEIQNVKKQKKQSKNPPLNVKTLQNNPKKLITVKKKKKPKQSKPVQDEIDWENNDDESNAAKNSKVILNQTNITEFFNTVKTNSASHKGENVKETKKQEVPNVDELLDDDDLFYSNLYSNQNPTTNCKGQDFPVSQFQNPDYLNFLSFRNHDNNTIDVRDDFENTKSSLRRGEIHTKENVNWKTFNEMNSYTDCDFSIERKKTIAPSVFYSRRKSNTKTSSKHSEINNNSVHLKARNQDTGIISNEIQIGEQTWLNMLKDDQEKMANLLREVESMNDVISKSIQDISKFFGSRNN